MKCKFSKQYSTIGDIGQTPHTQILLVQKRKSKKSKKGNSYLSSQKAVDGSG